MSKVAINGMGRIGRAVLKIVLDTPELELAAVNDLLSLDIDLVFECTGVFRNKEDLEKHLEAGAKHVILSAPEKTGTVDMVVGGVNQPEGSPALISCASCTTNCIAPVVEILDRRIGVKKAVMTTAHAYTSSQSLVDGDLLKVMSWYDNEWGYSAQMVREAVRMTGT
jgi:glyceraldehyde 3-phosphate dehydrogenase